MRDEGWDGRERTFAHVFPRPPSPIPHPPSPYMLTSLSKKSCGHWSVNPF